MLLGKKIIALCTSRIGDSSTFEFVKELNDLLVANNCRLFVYHLSSDYCWLEDYMAVDSAVFDLIDYSIIDGLVLMDEKIKNPELVEGIINSAKKENVPVITIDSKYDGCIHTLFDYGKGIEQIIRHIIEGHGIRDVHFMAGYKDNEYSEERLDVFKKVLAENEIAFSEDMVSYGDFWAMPTRKATLKLLEREKLPRAIICANDVMAINVCAVLKEHGVVIPTDVIVTGFDGIDEIYATNPQITTANCNNQLMARKVSKLFVKMFNGEQVEIDNYIVPEFVCAQSCGCNESKRLDDLDYYNRLNIRFYRYQDNNRLLSYISEQMQRCETLDELCEVLKHDALREVVLVINKSCTDETQNMSAINDREHFDDELIALHKFKNSEENYRQFNIKDVYKQLDSDMLEMKNPLIFNAVCSLNRLYGFACFFCRNVDMTSYYDVPQMIVAFANGIGVYMNMHHQKYLLDKMAAMFRNDTLTGLYNRTGFNQEYDKLLKSIRGTGEYITVVLSDLDHLKQINDRFGHVYGDKAIKTTAKALAQACPEGAICMRLGGDEMFAVIKGQADTDEILRKMEDFLAEYNHTLKLPFEVETSVGFYTTNNELEFEFDDLVSNADIEMYKVKKVHHKRALEMQ